MFRVFVLGLSLALLRPGAASATPSTCPKPTGAADALARLDRLESSKLAWGRGVQVTRDGQPVPAEACLLLRRGDLVETGANVTVVIQFAEGLVLLMPNTRVRIGSIWTYFGELFSFGRVKLQDRYVTAGAEGTSYVFRSDPQGTTVTVLQGHVRVTPEQEAIAAQRLESGQRVVVSPNATPSAAPNLTRISPAEVSEKLQSYQALTGYSAAELAFLEQGFTKLIGRPRNTASLLVQGSFSFGGGGAAMEIGASSLALAWSHRFPVPGAFQFGSRLQGGATFGRYRSPVTDEPTKRAEAANAGSARLPFQGAFAKLDAELGRNLGLWTFVGSLGLRGGWSHQPDVTDDGANAFVWGPALSARTEYALARGFQGLFEIELSVQKTPIAACPIDCNGPAVPLDSIWQAWLGFAIGVGVDL